MHWYYQCSQSLYLILFIFAEIQIKMSHNIATKSKQEQDTIQYDLLTSFWAYKEKRGLMSKPEIFKHIHAEYQDPAMQEYLIQRYEYFKAM